MWSVAYVSRQALRGNAGHASFAFSITLFASPFFNSEPQPDPELRLTREAAAAAETDRSEERRADALITARIVEVCVVGQVVNLGHEVESLLLAEVMAIGDPQIRLEEIRTVRAIDAAIVFDVLQRARCGAAVCAR